MRPLPLLMQLWPVAQAWECLWVRPLPLLMQLWPVAQARGCLWARPLPLLMRLWPLAQPQLRQSRRFPAPYQTHNP